MSLIPFFHVWPWRHLGPFPCDHPVFAKREGFFQIRIIHMLGAQAGQGFFNFIRIKGSSQDGGQVCSSAFYQPLGLDRFRIDMACQEMGSVEEKGICQ